MILSPTGFSGCLAAWGSKHRICSWYGTSSKCLSPRAVLWGAGTFQLWRHWSCLWLFGPAPPRWSLLLFGLIESSSHLKYLVLRWLSYNREVNWSASMHSTSLMQGAGISSSEDPCADGQIWLALIQNIFVIHCTLETLMRQLLGKPSWFLNQGG